MGDVRRLLAEEAQRIEPSRDGLVQTYRRIRRRQRRQRITAGAIGLLLCLVSALIWTPWLETRPERQPNQPNPTLVSGSSDQGSLAQRSIRGEPLDGAVGAGSAWALLCEAPCSERMRGKLLRLDLSSGSVLSATSVDAPQAMAVGEGGIWVVSLHNSTVTRIDPATGQAVATIQLELPFEVRPGDSRFLPFDVAVGEGGVWVTTARGALARVDPQTNRVVATVRLPGDSTGMVATGKGAVWVAESVLGVYRLDPARNQIMAKIPVDGGKGRLAVTDVTVGGGAVWLMGESTRETAGSTSKHPDYVLTGSPELVRLDPAQNRPVSTFLVRQGRQLVAYAKQSVWMVASKEMRVDRIDPGSGRVLATVQLRSGERLIAMLSDAILVGDPQGRYRRIALDIP